MTESLALAGLRTVAFAPPDPQPLIVVVLHGYAMTPEDLAPFARSMGVSARFLFPEGPVAALPAGRAWWPIDQEARTEAIAKGPRDLAAEHPAGAAAARKTLVAFMAEARSLWPGSRLALVGFSQGGMLACDTTLREQPGVVALALLSSSRLSADDWQPLVGRLRGLPVLVSHGRADPDLAFAAGERLRDLLASGGADVSWVPFEQGHEIPLEVWRALRKFLAKLS